MKTIDLSIGDVQLCMSPEDKSEWRNLRGDEWTVCFECMWPNSTLTSPSTKTWELTSDDANENTNEIYWSLHWWCAIMDSASQARVTEVRGEELCSIHEHPNLLLKPQIKGLPLLIHSKTNMKTIDLSIGDVQLCMSPEDKSEWRNLRGDEWTVCFECMWPNSTLTSPSTKTWELTSDDANENTNEIYWSLHWWCAIMDSASQARVTEVRGEELCSVYEHPNLLRKPEIKGLPPLMIYSKTNMWIIDHCIGDVQLCLEGGHMSGQTWMKQLIKTWWNCMVYTSVHKCVLASWGAFFNCPRGVVGLWEACEFPCKARGFTGQRESLGPLALASHGHNTPLTHCHWTETTQGRLQVAMDKGVA